MITKFLEEEIIMKIKNLAVLGIGVLAAASSIGFTPDVVLAAPTNQVYNTSQVKQLGVGEVTVYDFGTIKIHAYKTNDVLVDESYVLEKGNNLVLLEASAFKQQNQEFADYIKSLGKPVAGALLAYHPNGYDRYHATVYATDNAVKNWQAGGSIKGLTDNFVQAFGDTVDTSLPTSAKHLTFGKSVSLGGIKFNIIDAGDDAYSVEIPEINVIYRHMMGSTTHNILVSRQHIDAEIAFMKDYQAKNYALVLTSHFVPEGQEAVAQKIAYLEKVKELANTCKTKDEFIAAVKAAFPNYDGVNYLEMSAGFLFS